MGTIRKFRQAAVWLDGISLVGYVNQVELPTIEWGQTDHEAIGFFGVEQYPQRIEAMEATFTWMSYTTELAVAAADAFRGTRLQIIGSYGAYDSNGLIADDTLTIDIAGRWKSNPLGSLEQGIHERETMMSVNYVKETYNGQLILEVGINPPIYRVGANREDLLEVVRSSLGL